MAFSDQIGTVAHTPREGRWPIGPEQLNERLAEVRDAVDATEAAIAAAVAQVAAREFDAADMDDEGATQTLTLSSLSATHDALVTGAFLLADEQAATAGDLSALVADIGYDGGDELFDGVVLDDDTGAVYNTGTPALIPAGEAITVAITATGDTLDDVVTGAYRLYLVYALVDAA